MRPTGPGSANRGPTVSASVTRLRLVKQLHTLIWMFFATCVVALPLIASAGRLDLAPLPGAGYRPTAVEIRMTVRSSRAGFVSQWGNRSLSAAG
jgi:hypothetical protein